jgi:protein TonB
MTTERTIHARPIGAMELKRSYQSNLARGLILAAGLHLALVGAALLMSRSNDDVSGSSTVGPAEPRPFILRPPVEIIRELPQFGRQQVELPAAAIPRPVSDQMVSGDVTVRGLRRLLDSVGPAGTGHSGFRDGTGTSVPTHLDPVVGTFPEITEVIFGATEPVLVRSVQPDYPELAERSGLNGSVTLRVLVDTKGKVCSVVVARCSAPGLGFEEAACAAVARQYYKPALQNGHPVPVWIDVLVRFESK